MLHGTLTGTVHLFLVIRVYTETPYLWITARFMYGTRIHSETVIITTTYGITLPYVTLDSMWSMDGLPVILNSIVKKNTMYMDYLLIMSHKFNWKTLLQKEYSNKQ